MKTFEKDSRFYKSFTAYYQVAAKHLREVTMNNFEHECNWVLSFCPHPCICFMIDLQNSLKRELLRRIHSNADPDPVTKGSPFFEITGDYVILLNKYLDGINGEYPDSDEFWEQLAADVDQFYSAHRQKDPVKDLALDFALNFLREMERRYQTQVLCA